MMIPNMLRHIYHFETILEIRCLITALYQITFLKAIENFRSCMLDYVITVNHLWSDGICACGNNNESALHFFLNVIDLITIEYSCLEKPYFFIHSV